MHTMNEWMDDTVTPGSFSEKQLRLTQTHTQFVKWKEFRTSQLSICLNNHENALHGLEKSNYTMYIILHFEDALLQCNVFSI